MNESDVLIIGGGLSGLSAACFLSKLGVNVTLFERQGASSPQYTSEGISPRSMEIYRSFGLEPEIRSASATLETAAIARVPARWLTAVPRSQ